MRFIGLKHFFSFNLLATIHWSERFLCFLSNISNNFPLPIPWHLSNHQFKCLNPHQTTNQSQFRIIWTSHQNSTKSGNISTSLCVGRSFALLFNLPGKTPRSHHSAHSRCSRSRQPNNTVIRDDVRRRHFLDDFLNIYVLETQYFAKKMKTQLGCERNTASLAQTRW